MEIGSYVEFKSWTGHTPSEPSVLWTVGEKESSCLHCRLRMVQNYRMCVAHAVHQPHSPAFFPAICGGLRKMRIAVAKDRNTSVHKCIAVIEPNCSTGNLKCIPRIPSCSEKLMIEQSCCISVPIVPFPSCFSRRRCGGGIRANRQSLLTESNERRVWVAVKYMAN